MQVGCRPAGHGGESAEVFRQHRGHCGALAVLAPDVAGSAGRSTTAVGSLRRDHPVGIRPVPVSDNRAWLPVAAGKLGAATLGGAASIRTGTLVLEIGVETLRDTITRAAAGAAGCCTGVAGCCG